jgi:hypothetical protein
MVSPRAGHSWPKRCVSDDQGIPSPDSDCGPRSGHSYPEPWYVDFRAFPGPGRRGQLTTRVRVLQVGVTQKNFEPRQLSGHEDAAL